jgi:hypothetical protein
MPIGIATVLTAGYHDGASNFHGTPFTSTKYAVAVVDSENAVDVARLESSCDEEPAFDAEPDIEFSTSAGRGLGTSVGVFIVSLPEKEGVRKPALGSFLRALPLSVLTARSVTGMVPTW